MQQIRTCFFIASFILLTQQTAFAEEQYAPSTSQQAKEVDSSTTKTEMEFDPSLSQAKDDATEVVDNSSTSKDFLSEIIIRPVAVVGSITGFALFIAASPFSGLASIPEPHDTFKTTWNDFVVTPYYFAFRRPLGDYSVELN